MATFVGTTQAGLLLFAAMVVMIEVGRWLGRSWRERHGGATEMGAGAVEGAVFGLLGLLIAFTFSGAASRFDQRRALIVEEANDIGTAWLRIDLLPPPAQPAIRQKFREYVDTRIAVYRALPDVSAAEEHLARANAIQGEIWQLAIPAVQAAPAPVTTVLPPGRERHVRHFEYENLERAHPPSICDLRPADPAVVVLRAVCRLWHVVGRSQLALYARLCAGPVRRSVRHQRPRVFPHRVDSTAKGLTRRSSTSARQCIESPRECLDLLILAALLEIGWPLGLKLSQSPDRRVAGLVAAGVCMLASGALLWLAQRDIPIGTAYAVWTGIGAAGTFAGRHPVLSRHGIAITYRVGRADRARRRWTQARYSVTANGLALKRVFTLSSQAGDTMDLSLYFSEQHLQVRDMVREFARTEVAPVARELDAHRPSPGTTSARWASLGLLGVPWSEELGGAGMDQLSYYITIHELAKVDASHALTISAHTNLGTSPIVEFGTEEQQQRYVPLLASGKVLGGFGLTEPGAGSDAGGTATTAVDKGDHYLLNGSKIFITHAGVGEIFVVTARTEPGKRQPGHHQLHRDQGHRRPR